MYIKTSIHNFSNLLPTQTLLNTTYMESHLVNGKFVIIVYTTNLLVCLWFASVS